jgi:hypothetical protein
MDAHAKLKGMAAQLPQSSWKPLKRRPKYDVKTKPRAKRPNVKEDIVRERCYRSMRLDSEQLAEFDYRPTKCTKSYRMVVLRKNLTIARGEQALFHEFKYFFYITNCRNYGAATIVKHSNDRCNQENLIEQLKNGVKALSMPVDNLVSNWAYMVIASLAWSLKAWFALLLPERGRWSRKHAAQKRTVLRMEFRTFFNAFILIPCQLAHKGRRVVFRILAWNPWVEVLLRGFTAQARPLC